METVLVSGIHGFIGSHVARYFLKTGHRVIGIDLQAVPAGPWADYVSLRLPSPDLDIYLHNWQPSVCVHCAGPASVGESILDPTGDFAGSVVATQNLLDALRRKSPDCRFLYLSSAAVYGNPVCLPISEQDPVQPVSPYGFHKSMCESLCLEFHRVYGLRTAAVRIFSAYGYGLRRQVIFEILKKLTDSREGTLDLHGSGDETRDFIHVSDIVAGIRTVVENASFEGGAYNLASGQSISISALAAMLRDRANPACQIRFLGDRREGDPLYWSADIRKLQALGFSLSTSIETGLSEYVDQHTQAHLV